MIHISINNGAFETERGLIVCLIRLKPSAYELRAAAISSLAAAAVMWTPSTFLLTRELVWGFAGVFVCHAVWRGIAGLKIVRYRANLRRRRRYVVMSEEIPWSA